MNKLANELYGKNYEPKQFGNIQEQKTGLVADDRNLQVGCDILEAGRTVKGNPAV